MNNKRILFITGTRADFGKIKSLINAIDNSNNFEYSIFITGMHTLKKYGSTIQEVQDNFKNTFVYLNQFENQPMEQILASTIDGLSKYLIENPYDMMIIHGDRIETLAAAIVGALRNILVTHIEGGEVSGTVDELIRHSTSKLAHFHLVANNKAKTRLLQMGEKEKNIFIIGSPDIDVMLSKKLPSLDKVKKRYEIHFEKFAITMFHPVTTELEKLEAHCASMMQAMQESEKQYIIIYPNNDHGTNSIFSVYQKYKTEKNFKFFPSLRFEYFLTLLKSAQFIIGNSSAGIREAPIYGIPVINIGTRQRKRHRSKTILNVIPNIAEIKHAITAACNMEKGHSDYTFGDGRSADNFMQFLNTSNIWKNNTQKEFIDIL